MAELGLRQAELARRMTERGLPMTSDKLNKSLQGIRKFEAEEFLVAMEILNKPVDYAADDPLPPGEVSEIKEGIPLVGRAEAGAFRQIDNPTPWLSEQDMPQIHADKSTSFPHVRHFCMQVGGDSMNDADPKPITEDDFVCCVDMSETGLPMIDGEIYVVRRTRDHGQTYEWSVKRGRVYEDRYELVPESTNPVHRPFVIPRRPYDGTAHPDDTTEEILVIGLVYAIHSHVSRFA